MSKRIGSYLYWALGLALVTAGCTGRSSGDGDPPAAPAPASGPIVMTDATSAAGIKFVHSHGGSGRHYMIETFAGGCAFFDYDSDGWPDIFLVQEAPLPG